MTGWQTYRNGNPREPWDLERLARHHAAKDTPNNNCYDFGDCLGLIV